MNGNYDIIKAGNFVVLIWMSYILFQPGDYLASSPRLHTLNLVGSETSWAVATLICGLLEAVLLIVTGHPPLFPHSATAAFIWRIFETVGFLSCLALYLTLLLLMGQTGPSWMGAMCGVFSLFCFCGCAKTGQAIAVDPSYIRYRKLSLAAKTEEVDAATTESIAMEGTG